MSKFQVILLSVFGFFILLSVVVFSQYRGSSNASSEVTIWGSFNSFEFNAFLNNSGVTQEKDVKINYLEIPDQDIEARFTEALATGRGPDLIILSQENYWKNREKLVPIPFDSITAREFKDTFAEIGELFLYPDRGIYALPLAIDPLVLYYNRDILSSASIAKPIQYWDEVYDTSLKLTKKDGAGNIIQSAISLGDVRNIYNAKEIISMLFLQAGTPIMSLAGGNLSSSISDNFGLPVPPANVAVDFFTQFANPSKTFYSWNPSLPEAQTAFASGDVAYYIGFASEYSSIKSKSPTLNFAVAPVPQSRADGRTITFGKVYGIALARNSKNIQASITSATKLVSNSKAQMFSQAFAIPPARRDLLSVRPTDSVLPVFYQSGLQARGFIDPDREVTKNLFESMLFEVSSGRVRTSEAVLEIDRRLESLLK